MEIQTIIDNGLAKTYWELGGKGQEHGLLVGAASTKHGEPCGSDWRKIKIARLTDDGLKLHPRLGEYTAESAPLAQAIAICLTEAANAQNDYDEDMKVERAAQRKAKAAEFKTALTERVESKRQLLHDDFMEAMDAGDLERGEDILITLAGFGDKSAVEILADLDGAGS